MESQSDTVDESERVSGDKDKSKDKDKEVMSCHVMSPRPAAQSTMESQSDTVDKGKWEAPISSDKDKSKDKDKEVKNQQNQKDTKSKHQEKDAQQEPTEGAPRRVEAEEAQAHGVTKSFESKKLTKDHNADDRAAKKPKHGKKQEGKGSDSEQEAPIILQRFKRQK